jgi:hypothetical protein
VTATSLPGGQTGIGRWLLKAMGVVTGKTARSREKSKMDKELTEIRERMEELE